MRKVFLIIIFFSSQFIHSNKSLNGNDEYQISILTVGPGIDLVDAFGHTGIRIIDKKNNLDLVFNFGIYDYNAPNFYSNFFKGRPIFSLGINRFNDFFDSYVKQNRKVYEQIIKTTKERKKIIVESLIKNSQEENKYYIYEYFEDNCSTRVADIFINEIGELKVDLDKKTKFSYRELIYSKIGKNSIGSLGIDLCLGSKIDNKITTRQTFFLPEKLKEFLDIIEDNNPNLVETKLLYSPNDTNSYKQQNIFKPLWVSLLISIVIIWLTFKDFKRKKQTKILDFLILTTLTIIGILIGYLWIFSNHSNGAMNLNILWANPLNFLLIFYFFRNKKSKLTRLFLNFLIISIFVVIVFWVIQLQIFNLSIIPILFGLLLRYFYLREIY